MPKVDLWIFPNHWSSFWLCSSYAEFPHPLRATVHNPHMFSSSSPPTYIASIRGCSPYQHAPASDPSSTLTKKTLRSCAVTFVFSCQAPCQAFVSYPWDWSGASINCKELQERNHVHWVDWPVVRSPEFPFAWTLDHFSSNITDITFGG